MILSRHTGVLLGLLLLNPVDVFACTCAKIPPEQEVVRYYTGLAEVVALVEVLNTRIETYEHNGMSLQRQIARVRAIEPFKGAEVNDELEVLDSGMLCGLSLRESETFVLFLYPERFFDYLAVSGCNNFLVNSPPELVPARKESSASHGKLILTTLRSIQ